VLLLCAIPLGAGVVRLVALSRGAPITPDNARFVASPLPIVLHVVCVSLYVALGAYQLTPAFRRQRPRWHRRVGWLAVIGGVFGTASGLWMQTFYVMPTPRSAMLLAARWLFGSALIACLALGVRAIQRGDRTGHGAWMLRAYAIGVGAGTQSLLLVPVVVLLGMPPPLLEAVLMAAGWLLNLTLAEVLIRRRDAGTHSYAAA
jgi:uncharacterized membrane protein